MPSIASQPSPPSGAGPENAPNTLICFRLGCELHQLRRCLAALADEPIGSCHESRGPRGPTPGQLLGAERALHEYRRLLEQLECTADTTPARQAATSAADIILSNGLEKISAPDFVEGIQFMMDQARSSQRREPLDPESIREGWTLVDCFRAAHPGAGIVSWNRYADADKVEIQGHLDRVADGIVKARLTTLSDCEFNVLEEQVVSPAQALGSPGRHLYQLGSLLGLASWQAWLPEIEAFRDLIPTAMATIGSATGRGFAEVTGMDTDAVERLVPDVPRLWGDWTRKLRSEAPARCACLPRDLQKLAGSPTTGRGRPTGQERQLRPHRLAKRVRWGGDWPTWRDHLIRWCKVRHRWICKKLRRGDSLPGQRSPVPPEVLLWIDRGGGGCSFWRSRSAFPRTRAAGRSTLFRS